MTVPLASARENRLTPASFDSLLLRLDPDRDRAGEKYEGIRWRLIRFFQWNGLVEAEDLADETFNRVAAKLASETDVIQDAPAFIWGVAKHLRLEAGRKEVKTVTLPDALSAETARGNVATATNSRDGSTPDDERLKCLRGCLQCLSHKDRKLLMMYHSPKGRRVEGRRRLAREMGITTLNLRVRANRLRYKIEECMKKCPGSKAIERNHRA